MVYQVGKMVLQETQEVFRGKVNDVIICQDMANSGKMYYTVIVVHERNLAKKLMDIFHGKQQQQKNKFVADYTWKDSYIMIFDYVRERSLQQFFKSEVGTLAECEELCLNFTVECLACGVPFPMLYLMIMQDQINVSKDKEVYFSYCINLEEFSESVGEKECATLCAQKIFNMLSEFGAAKATSYKLLERRSWKSGYHRLVDLYKDLKMASAPLKREGIFSRIGKFYRHNKDRIFKLLLIVCVLLAVLALTMIISQLIFWDFPFIRLFFNTFKKIGKESLLQ